MEDDGPKAIKRIAEEHEQGWRPNRRDILGATIATAASGAFPLTASALSARHEIKDADLSFELSDDKRHVAIGVISENLETLALAPGTALRSSEIWHLDAESFGPDATFALGAQNVRGFGTAQPSYTLFVRNIRFGRDYPAAVDSNGKGRLAQFQFFLFGAGNEKRWHLRMETNFWSPGLGHRPFQLGLAGRDESKPAAPADLRDFIAGRLQLRQWISGARVTGTLQRVFNGLVSARQKVIALYFHADGTWQLQPTVEGKEAILEGLHPGLLLDRLTLGWAHPESPSGPDDEPLSPSGATNLGLALEAVTVQSGSAVVGLGKVIEPFEALSFGVSTAQAVLMPEAARPADADRDRAKSLILRTIEKPPEGSNEGDIQIQSSAVIERLWQVSVRRDKSSVTGPFPQVWGRLRADAVLAASASTDRVVFKLDYMFDGDFASAQSFNVSTPAGNLTVSGIKAESRKKLRSTSATAEEQPAPDAQAPVGPETSEAKSVNGPFRNMVGSAVRILSCQVGKRDPGRAALKWLEVTTQLEQAYFALAGTSHSTLNFAQSELLFWYSDDDKGVLPRDSFIRLTDVAPGETLARIDLSRATLRAVRTEDLLSLKFRFAKMALELAQGAEAAVPRIEIVNTSQTCGVASTLAPRQALVLARGAVDDQPSQQQTFPPTDTRSVLVVEFPPQHLFEEAVFVPDPDELPDQLINQPNDSNPLRLVGTRIDGLWDVQFIRKDKSPASSVDVFNVDPDNKTEVLRVLGSLDNADHRASVRRSLCNEKSKDNSFKAFANDFSRMSIFRPYPWRTAEQAAQSIYIGPFGMDPDIHLQARALRAANRKSLIDEHVTRILAAARQQAVAILRSDGVAGNKMFGDQAADFGTALLLEGRLESAVPEYQLFRAWYREWIIGGAAKVTQISREDLEFVIDLSKSDWANRKWTRSDLAKRELSARDAYRDYILAQDALDGRLMQGRWSDPSRLAFFVECRDAVAASRAVVPDIDHDEDEGLGLGRNRLGYRLEDLTNWSSMELSVVRRAQRVYAPGRGGRLDSKGGRVVDLSASARLDQLGFQSGSFVTAAMRSADITQSMSERPGPSETELVIPARLSLSPSNEGIFLCRRPIPRAIFHHDSEVQYQPGDLINSGPIGTTVLWSAWLDTTENNPEVRAVHSPDFRADFMWSPLATFGAGVMTGGKIERLPGSGQPIAGSVAPWLIGPEETIAANPTPFAIANSIDGRLMDPVSQQELGAVISGKEATPTEEGFCQRVVDAEANETTRGLLPRLISYLCARDKIKNPAKQRQFVTGLSANDRHQLVVLSSGFGLPVMGLGSGSSDVVVPDPRYQLVDILPGSGLYNPKPLDVTELSLSALGGSLRHSTSFEPPASPKHISGRNLYDALSVERWQQWTVLGRDVFSEIVYKGFLLPIGHRAALVKVTQRTFIRDEATRLVRAYLRQHMFIRVSKPDKKFAATLQPNGGRRFPISVAHIITQVTPDIVDPYGSLVSDPQSSDPTVLPSGRIWLGQAPGLAFWPRTLRLAGTEVRFDIMFDKVRADLPLIFVDNVAANDPTAIAKLIKFYNEIPSPDKPDLEPIDPARHQRTLRFGGETMRYAPETKSGSASFDSDSWTLIAEGRANGRPVKAPAPSTAGDTSGQNGVQYQHFDVENTVYALTPSMQSNDQPPFYPAIETARIRLRQNEHLTGKKDGALRAVFDAHYVANGLPLPTPTPEGSGNSVTADQRLADSASAIGNGMQIFLNLIDQPTQDMGTKGDQSGGLFRPAGSIIAISRSKGAVTSEKPLKVPLSPSGPVPNLSLAEAHTTAAKTPDSGALAGAMRKASDIYKSFFSDDAKILGLVPIRKLLELLEDEMLDDPSNGTPHLMERISYGAGASAESAADSTAYVRQHVLVPLAQAVKAIRERWSALNADMVKAQSDAVSRTVKQLAGDGLAPIGLNELFPEIDASLAALDGSAQDALAETEELPFALALSVVYESGRRFLDAIEHTSSDPGTAFEQALKSRFDSLESLLQGFSQQLGQFVALAWEQAEKQIPDAVARLIVPGDDSAPFPWFALPISRLTRDGVPNLEVSRGTARAAIRDIVDMGLHGTLTHDTALAALRQAVLPTIDDARQKIESSPDYQKFRDEFRSYQLLVLQAETVFAEDVSWLEDLGLKFKALKAAAALPDIAAFANASADVLNLLVGPQNVLFDKSCTPLPNDFTTAFTTFAGSLKLNHLALARPNPAGDSDAPLAPNSFFVVGQDDLLDQRYPPANDDLLLKGLKDAHDVLDETVRNADALASLLSGGTDAPPAVPRGVNVLRRLAKDLRHEITMAYADLVNDSLRLSAIQNAFEAVVETLNGVGFCDPKGTITAFGRLGSLGRSFVKGRMDLLGHLTQHVSRIARSTDAAFNDPDVSVVVAFTPAIVERWKRDASGLIDKLIRGILSALTACTVAGPGSSFDLVTLVNDLADGLDKIDKQVKSAKIPLVDVQPADLSESTKSLRNLSAFLAKANSQMLGVKSRFLIYPSNLTDILVGKVPILKFYTVDPSVAPDQITLDLMSKVESFAEKYFESLCLALEQKAMFISQAALKRLDLFVYDALASSFPAILPAILPDRPSGFLQAAYAMAAKLFDQMLSAIGSPDVRAGVVNKLARDIPVRTAWTGEASEEYRIQQDADRLRAILVSRASATPVSDQIHRDYLIAFLKEWAAGTSTPEAMLKNARDLFIQLVRGEFLQLIDLPSLRAATEEYLLSLIPTKIELSYGFRTALSKKLAGATAGIFEPEDGSTFSVDASAVIDLLTPSGEPAVNMQSTGRLGPFKINLVGAFDAVKISFRGAEFVTRSGDKPRYTIDYDDVVIGEKLSFVQALQQYFNPSTGSPFRILPTISPLGIAATYRLDLGIISIGTVSFFNVAIEASAVLPFTNDGARFRGSLSSRLSPFTISAAPYGGSGFFAIEADATGIVGFEASFEYGGAGAFKFGPLTGQGRLMAGVYIRQQTLSTGKVTEISGTFFCGGSANIWIFSFGASLYVHMGMVNGNMSGEAVFTFSFSMGIKDFHYSVSVNKQEGKGFSSQRSDSGAYLVASALGVPPAAGGPRPNMALVETDVVGEDENWGRYAKYFVPLVDNGGWL